jgi:hypothetical protein
MKAVKMPILLFIWRLRAVMRLWPPGRISFCLASSGVNGNSDFDHLQKEIQRSSKFNFSE